MKRLGLVLFVVTLAVVIGYTDTGYTQETIEILTYYPAPYGVYETLRVNGELSRLNSTCNGTNANTHINLGWDSSTGSALVGVNNTYCTIGGGNQNTASWPSATISGGQQNIATGLAATIGGGSTNTVWGQSSTVAGGINNRITTAWSTIGGGDSNIASGVNYATVGGGNQNTASGPNSIIGGGTGNTASGLWATIGGGENNIASGNTPPGGHSTVGGGRLNTASNLDATVGGGQGNTASGQSATIGGGVWNSTGDACTIAGGANNLAIGSHTFIGGGNQNTATGAVVDAYITIGGGRLNTASGQYGTIGGGILNNCSGTYYATIGGGGGNTAGGSSSAVGGGLYNRTSGQYATIAGGAYNSAGGNYSFAGGRHAKAYNNGCFVWADSTNTDYPLATDTTLADDQFRVRANGGIYMVGITEVAQGVNPMYYDLDTGELQYVVSSIVYKENIHPFVDNFSRILELNPKSFTFKSSGKEGFGYIAEDLDEIGLKNLVSYNKDNKPRSIVYGTFPIYIIEVLKEKEIQIVSLQKEVKELQEKYSKMDKELQSIKRLIKKK